MTKSDLKPMPHVKELLTINTVEADGLDPLLNFLQTRLQGLSTLPQSPLVTRERHRQALSEAQEFLSRARKSSDPLEIRSENLRLASDCLGRITGRIDVEDLLDVIFSEFCIGK